MTAVGEPPGNSARNVPGFRTAAAGLRPAPANSNNVTQINVIDGHVAILTWSGAVSMVRAAFEGDGASFSFTAASCRVCSMAQGTHEGEDGSGGQSSSDEAALSARLGSLDHRLSELRGSRRPGTDQPDAGSGDGTARASAMARGLRLSSELVAGVVVGALIGWGFDRLLSTSPFGLIVFFLLGFAAGVLNVVRSAGVAPDRTGR
jgi:ATP synthase protein I